MSFRGRPALKASAMPSPVTVWAYVVNPNIRPVPPVAMMSALPWKASSSPVVMSIAVNPANRPSAVWIEVTNVSSYRLKLLYFSSVS